MSTISSRPTTWLSRTAGAAGIFLQRGRRDVGGPFGRGAPFARSAGCAGDLETAERALIVQGLEKARFNNSKAARDLGLTRQQPYVRLRRYRLE